MYVYKQHTGAQYMTQALSQHKNCDCQGCGLVLSSDYPMFGASPDGLEECKCCGLGCLEMICPFILKHEDLCDVSRLKAVSGEYRLDHSNRYFLPDSDANVFEW